MSDVKTFPNLNGNTKESLRAQYIGLMSEFSELRKYFLRCDFFHGRNSIDGEHATKLREKRTELLSLLDKFEEELNGVVINAI